MALIAFVSGSDSLLKRCCDAHCLGEEYCQVSIVLSFLEGGDFLMFSFAFITEDLVSFLPPLREEPMGPLDPSLLAEKESSNLPPKKSSHVDFDPTLASLSRFLSTLTGD